MVKWQSLLVVALFVVLASAACRSMTYDDTVIIAPGGSVSWDVREYDSCEYSFFVRQHDIGFEGERYTEKEGTFTGGRFKLDNGYSLFTNKAVDVKLRCS